MVTIRLDLSHLYGNAELEEAYQTARSQIAQAGRAPRELHLIEPGYHASDADPDSDEDESDVDSDGVDALTRPNYIARYGLYDFLRSTSDWSRAFIDLARFPNFANYLFDKQYKRPARLWHRLRTLTLVSSRDNFVGEGDSEVECNRVFLKPENFPALREVALDLPDCRFHTTFTLPWHQLTSLTLESFIDPFSDYFHALGQCSSLEKLHITIVTRTSWGFEYSMSESSPSAPVTIPALVELAVDLHNRCDIVESFIDKVTLPSLRRVNITGVEDQSAFLQALSRLTERSRCQLDRVCLEREPHSPRSRLQGR
ncbi:hypothetical protein NMY22_g9362 [Coprinellus aureogranulatus]|nr:hypothetical protein NMY22_g9362 [Coprinellus aureogranulatus]